MAALITLYGTVRIFDWCAGCAPTPLIRQGKIYNMEQKLTAQIASAYMPCKITESNGEGVHYDMVGISEYESMLQVSMPSGDSDWWNIDIFKLLLTPLSKITDEDAVEVAKIVYPVSVSKHNPITGKMLIQYAGKIDFEGNIHIIDFLRSSEWNGRKKPAYDCGHGPIESLIDARIAIDATTADTAAMKCTVCGEKLSGRMEVLTGKCEDC